MSILESISQLRRDVDKGALSVDSLKDDPLDQFSAWFAEALESDILDPNAMTLSTAGADGRPSARVVLLKKYGPGGFVFYTNYESLKAIQLAENPYASVLFFWDVLSRQALISGRVEKISSEESFEYFKTRDYRSRIGAWASKQSATLKSRFTLMREVAALAAKFKGGVPLPPHWGGYRLVPEEYEFWQGRKSRLHDRFRYTPAEDGWKIERLYP